VWWIGLTALLVIVLTACAADYRVGRDALAVTVWEQRGEAVGDFAYIYCTRAAARERLIFLWGVQRTLGPHRLVITCNPELLLGPAEDER
jgi:hypothetical protein